jgi:hypothetical protein
MKVMEYLQNMGMSDLNYLVTDLEVLRTKVKVVIHTSVP